MSNKNDIRKLAVKLSKSRNVAIKNIRALDNVGLGDIASEIDINKLPNDANEIMSMINQLNEFNKTESVTNKHGYRISMKDVRKASKMISEINSINEGIYEKVKNMNIKIPSLTGSGFNTIESQMTAEEAKNIGDPKFRELMPKKANFNTNVRGTASFKDRMQNLTRTYKRVISGSRHETYRDNYIKALENMYGNMASDEIEQLKKMSVEEFMDMYYTSELGDIEYRYMLNDNINNYNSIKNQMIEHHKTYTDYSSQSNFNSKNGFLTEKGMNARASNVGVDDYDIALFEMIKNYKK